MKKQELAEKLWEEVQNWNRGNDYDGDLEFAVDHNFQDVAIYLWCGTGASNIKFNKCPVSIKEFQKECKVYNKVIDRFICKKCNHHGIYSKGEFKSINWCYGCGDKTEKFPE